MPFSDLLQRHLMSISGPCTNAWWRPDKLAEVQDWTTYDVDDVAAGLQNFLICIEMFPAALAHAYAFPPRDYLDPSIQPRQPGALPEGHVRCA